jgi:ZIP family zinc transporter
LETWLSVLLYATVAGATMPLGELTARIEHIRPQWLEEDFRHAVIAFGGGVLLAAVALVLVPEGKKDLPLGAAVAAFLLGGVVFCLVDRAIARVGGSMSQLMAMLLDFVPEAMALAATLATDPGLGLLLALLIAVQNYPEGFNAYRELVASGVRPRAVLLVLAALVALGPIAAAMGYAWLRDLPALLGGLMLFAASGILYLTFQDLAPQAKLEKQWWPSLGAVAGFLVGLVGEHLVR